MYPGNDLKTYILQSIKDSNNINYFKYFKQFQKLTLFVVGLLMLRL